MGGKKGARERVKGVISSFFPFPQNMHSCWGFRTSREKWGYTELHFLVEFNEPLQALQDAEVRETESYTNDMQLSITTLS